jgi:hypothetical protein
MKNQQHEPVIGSLGYSQATHFTYPEMQPAGTLRVAEKVLTHHAFSNGHAVFDPSKRRIKDRSLMGGGPCWT